MTAPADNPVDTSAPSSPAGDSATDTAPNSTQVGQEIPTDSTNVGSTQAEATPEAAVVPGEGDADEAALAHEQYLKDQQFRQENPDEPVIRAANPAIGGEAFL